METYDGLIDGFCAIVDMEAFENASPEADIVFYSNLMGEEVPYIVQKNQVRFNGKSDRY